MIVYVLIAAFVGGLAVGGGGMNWYAEAKQARQEKALAEAQKKVDDLAAKAQTEAANKIVDMTAAFDAGELNAKTVTRTIYLKSQQVIANQPAFSNPACVAGADALQLLNSARAGAGVQLAANPAATDGGVPAAGPTTGRQDGNAVHGADSGRSDVSGVQPQTGSTSSSGQVSGTGTRGVPKNPLAK